MKPHLFNFITVYTKPLKVKVRRYIIFSCCGQFSISSLNFPENLEFTFFVQGEKMPRNFVSGGS
jgi:hypothetical protein